MQMLLILARGFFIESVKIEESQSALLQCLRLTEQTQMKCREIRSIMSSLKLMYYEAMLQTSHISNSHQAILQRNGYYSLHCHSKEKYCCLHCHVCSLIIPDNIFCGNRILLKLFVRKSRYVNL